MNALRGKLNLLRSALSKIEVIVNSINAKIIYLCPFAFLKCWNGPSGFSCSPSWSKYVPINKRIKPWICNKPSDSPKTKNAVIATNPGVNTNNGSARLSSKFLIPIITQRNANAARMDLKNKTNKLIVVNLD